MTDVFSFELTFDELRALVLFFRKNDEKLPDGLCRIQKSAEKFLYASMTREEAERFFYEV